jgi:hypothetical protein
LKKNNSWRNYFCINHLFQPASQLLTYFAANLSLISLVCIHVESSGVGDKEGYFFCKRGRKYRNSIRPNRVTGSGFWKATGIDKPVFSLGGEGRDSIGLKKTLVYYRGSAGKGTKTDWMMHEFRLPTKDNSTSTATVKAKISDQEAVRT